MEFNSTNQPTNQQDSNKKYLYIGIGVVILIIIIVIAIFIKKYLDEKEAFDNIARAELEVKSNTELIQEIKKTIEKTERTSLVEIEKATKNVETATKSAVEAKKAYDKKMEEIEAEKKKGGGFTLKDVKQLSVAGNNVLAEYTQMINTEKQAKLTKTILDTLKTESAKELKGLTERLSDSNKMKSEWENKLKQAIDKSKDFQPNNNAENKSKWDQKLKEARDRIKKK